MQEYYYSHSRALNRVPSTLSVDLISQGILAACNYYMQREVRRLFSSGAGYLSADLCRDPLSYVCVGDRRRRERSIASHE